ncbi:MAG: single-stranded-DNA-specific exonuclease RecJ [Candidatus Methylopumilus sp.]|nr:single-stranded-DNA-specific exonuclease RecJ [Candidatus Methylopumilus sp.]
MLIKSKKIDNTAAEALVNSGLNPYLAKFYAARGIKHIDDATLSIDKIIPPSTLKNNGLMASILADAITQRYKILIIGDYDTDGATSTAVAVRALRMMGADVDYLVPNRFEFGYGLTPEIVDLAKQKNPKIIITVDNGIASVEGVNQANKYGIDVLITDHHLPGDQLPLAKCIVNPNQHGCDFPSKYLCGVGVIFYVMLALRAELRKREHFSEDAEPNLMQLIDLVALGTVADLVPLDRNNRILVEYGIRKIRTGQSNPGIRALMAMTKKNSSQFQTSDLAFSIAPRLNAAGRLDDMALGIQCLLSDNYDEARFIASSLEMLNLKRRSIESEMKDGASIQLHDINCEAQFSIALYYPTWHQGVIGIIASRIKDKYHRPVIIFAKSDEGILKGSGRSIQSLHLRDVLDLISKKEPNILITFGGHAMAAGLSIKEKDFDLFVRLFEETVQGLITSNDLELTIEVDDALNFSEVTYEDVQHINAQVWGQGFPLPIFEGEFEVVDQKILADKHLKLNLLLQNKVFEAIYFNHSEHLPRKIKAIYQVDSNEFNGNKKIQLQLKMLL